jgi:hypothetical protein
MLIRPLLRGRDAQRVAGDRMVQNNHVPVVHFNKEKHREPPHNRAYFNRQWAPPSNTDDAAHL